jgi:hypothetical protein
LNAYNHGRRHSFSAIVFRYSSSVTFKYRCMVLRSAGLTRFEVEAARKSSADSFVPEVMPVEIDLRKLLPVHPSTCPGSHRFDAIYGSTRDSHAARIVPLKFPRQT